MQIMLTGQMPNISDKTGEFEYKGETKATVDMLREKAGIHTFDQAVAICSPGVDKKPVTILNMPENSMVAYVEDERRKLAFWMPIAHLDKRSVYSLAGRGERETADQNFPCERPSRARVVRHSDGRADRERLGRGKERRLAC